MPNFGPGFASGLGASIYSWHPHSFIELHLKSGLLHEFEPFGYSRLLVDAPLDLSSGCLLFFPVLRSTLNTSDSSPSCHCINNTKVYSSHALHRLLIKQQEAKAPKK
jgi:hypothetical protein